MAVRTKTILGLDIGVNSVGWALVEALVSEKAGKVLKFRCLVDAGVRVFPEGADRGGQGAEQSPNVKRREARASRRLHQRKSQRLSRLKILLQKYGLAPSNEEDWRRFLLRDPYSLRARGLDERLDLEEIGRALYHIAQRRGFKSNRRTHRGDKETGTVLKEISQLQKEIEDAGARTLGEYLYRLKSSGVGRVRGRYTHRDMYIEEFDTLWQKQSAYHGERLNEFIKKEIFDAIFYQRPLRIQKHLVGMCEYEKDRKRSPRATWYAQRFRMLQDINNLSIVNTATGEIQERLTNEQRLKLIELLGRSKEVTFDRIRKYLGLPESCVFNYEKDGKKSKLKGNTTEWHLRKVFKDRYDELPVEVRDEVVRALIFIDDEEVLRRHARDRWSLDEDATERLLKVQLESGYVHLSEKALKKIIPHLEAGYRYMEAVSKAGYRRRDERDVEDVRLLRPKDIPQLNNPLVRAALYQMRKVVNAIVCTYGRPDEIRVEMVRELKLPIKRRQEIVRQYKENERINEEARKRLIEEFGIPKPSRDDIIKYRLWEECRHQCPYTGRPIPKEALFTEDWDVEHILPLSRSLDDSYNNKTLCWAEENRKRKHNRTPFEAYGHDEARWAEIVRRIKCLPKAKRNRFYMKDIPDDFIARRLNDTAYIARETRAILEKVAGKGRVKISKGGVTAILRRLWGLETILGSKDKKNREDHRHHAIDAIVTALTTDSIIKKISERSVSQRGLRGVKIEAPWEGFREDVKKKVMEMVVSHRVRRKISGALHEETNYGILGTTDEKGQSLYAVRKAIEAITKKDLDYIADEKIKELILQHLTKHGVDLARDDEKSRQWKIAMDPSNPPYLPNRNGPPVPVKRVRLHKPSSAMIHLGYRAVESGSNHHIVIFEYTEGRKKGRWDGEVVTMFEAARRAVSGEPVVKRDLGEGRKFIMSLSTNEMVWIKDGEFAGFWRVQKMDVRKNIIFRPHYLGGKLKDTDRPPLILRRTPSSLQEMKVVKVCIDPIGRIVRAGD